MHVNSTIIATMFLTRKFLALSVLVVSVSMADAQRTYKPSSVFAAGNWYKISVTTDGVYKLDLPFLSSLRIPALFHQRK